MDEIATTKSSSWSIVKEIAIAVVAVSLTATLMYQIMFWLDRLIVWIAR